MNTGQFPTGRGEGHPPRVGGENGGRKKLSASETAHDRPVSRPLEACLLK